jgi:predicted  nucleic acid-binding Zn-ribbon protein
MIGYDGSSLDDALDEIDALKAEIERLRERIKDAEKAMEPESKPVQDYYKKYPDPVDADIGPCDH